MCLLPWTPEGNFLNDPGTANAFPTLAPKVGHLGGATSVQPVFRELAELLKRLRSLQGQPQIHVTKAKLKDTKRESKAAVFRGISSDNYGKRRDIEQWLGEHRTPQLSVHGARADQETTS